MRTSITSTLLLSLILILFQANSAQMAQEVQQFQIEKPGTIQADTDLQKITQEQSSLRQAIKMTFDNYHGYPFAVAPGATQEFYLEYHQDENVKAQIYTYWIDEDNTVKPPEYSQGQRIQVKVFNAQNHQLILSQRFLTQSGFSFTAMKDVRYILSFSNSQQNKASKMIELAISYLHPTTQHLVGVNHTLATTQSDTHSLHQELQSRIHHIEETMVMEQQMRGKLAYTAGKYLGYAIWEILVVVGIMALQVMLLKRVTQKSFGSVI